METIFETLRRILEKPIDFPEYRPPSWESPIENYLWGSFRFVGLNADTQISFGNFRVDMVVSSRLNNNKVIIECDGAQYHHWLIDDFRDDELLAIANLPIAHIKGKSIVRCSENCAATVIEKWFPEHKSTLGYASALEIAAEAGIEDRIDGGISFAGIGYTRKPFSRDDFTNSQYKIRELVRYLVGSTLDDINNFSEDDMKLIVRLRKQLEENNLVGRKLAHHELAAAYILIAYDEPFRSDLLAELNNFIETRKSDANLKYVLEEQNL
jgi:very-short-patch-repair endonuclease